jgi:hypothetical protein
VGICTDDHFLPTVVDSFDFTFSLPHSGCICITAGEQMPLFMSVGEAASFKKLCKIKPAKEMVSKAVRPIDCLSDDNYSCSYRAGIGLGGTNAEKPGI